MFLNLNLRFAYSTNDNIRNCSNPINVLNSFAEVLNQRKHDIICASTMSDLSVLLQLVSLYILKQFAYLS